MNTRIYALLIALALPVCAFAEDKDLDWTEGETTSSVGARFGAGVDWKVAKGFHLGYDAELRVDTDGLDRIYNTVGASYKAAKWLKLGASFSLINVNSADDGWLNRQRFAFDATFSKDFDRVKVSFRERIQGTHKAYDINTYQSPQTAWALRHRVKVEYNIPKSKFDPYASIELKNTLNAVNPNAFVYHTSDGRWYNTDPQYNDVYINRLRLVAGTTYKINKKNVLDFYAIADFNYDLDIDLNSEGKNKKDGSAYLTLQDSYYFGIGVAYTFKIGK